MAEDKVTNLYNAFVKNGYAMEPEAQFRENLKDPKKRKAAYDALVADGYNMEPFAEFESNIGFGAPAPTSPAPQQQTQATAIPAPTAEPEQTSTSVQFAPEQPAWRPTEQEKVRMSYQMHTMLNDFNQKSKARLEQSQHMAEPFTPEGRKKRRNMEFQAQLTGSPTTVMGLTEPTSAPASDGEQGDTAEGDVRQHPVQSGQSPVPYGVKYVDGKPVTQWLLPDGRLTTDFIEADQAEYGARAARLARSINVQIQRAEVELAELQKQYEESKSRVHKEWAEDYEKNTAPLASVLASQTYVPRQQGDKANSALRVAIRQKEEQIKDLIEERDRQSGKDVGFWRGFGRTVSDFRTWDFGMSDLSDAVTMLNAEQYSSPSATEGERKAGKAMLKSLYYRQEVENLYRGNASWWNRAGGMAGHMPAFIVDFALTGGGYGDIAKFGANVASKQATRWFGKQAIEEMAKLGVKKYAKKYGVQGVGRLAGNWAVKALGTTADDLLIRAPLMTNTIQGGKTTADIIDRKLGDVVVDENGNYDFSNDKTWGSAIWQGEANSIIENYSEMFGAHIDGLTPMLAKTFGGKRISGVLARANASGFRQVLDSTRKHFQRLGVSDYFGEVAEEYYGQMWRTMLNLDDAYTNVPVIDEHGNQKIDEHGNPITERKNLLFTGQFHGDIWGGMALSMGLIGAGKYTLTGVGYANMKRAVNQADRAASAILGSEYWEALRETIDNTTNEDMGALAENVIDDTNLSEVERAAVMVYMERCLNLRGLNLATLAHNRGAEAEEPTPEQAEAQSQYEQGRLLYGRFEEGDPTVQADVDAIALRMQEAYQAVEDVFGAEAEYYMFHVNENPWALVNDPELTAEQQDAVLYYINAKAALDGVMDASNEAADRKRAAVEQEVGKRTHKDNGMVIPATMKLDDRQVYVVKGDVVMFPDGTGVDVRNSSESVIVMDAQTGEYEFTSPDQIYKVSEAVNPQDEVRAAHAIIEQEQMNVFRENGVAPEEPAGAFMSEENSVTSQHGNGPEQNHDERAVARQADGGRVASDPAGGVEADRDRSDIRVYETGLAAAHDAYSLYSERDRREAESERLVGIARQNGQYINRSEYGSFGDRQLLHSGESEVYVDRTSGRVYKIKNPYAKSPMKGNVQPEEVIYEHLVHNKYFPETSYRFEGISDDAGDVRIVLSQDYVESIGQATKEQVESALAERGLYPQGKYTYGNDEVSVTDVTGDNALLGVDGKVYFIDPIIDFKKPVREILSDGIESDAGVPETPESVLNPTGNAVSAGEIVPETVSSVENGQQTALSRIPTNEQGEPMFEAVDKDTAWDGLVEAVGGEADAADIAMAQVQQASTDLEALKKKQPTLKAPKLKGSPMAMAQAKREAAEQYQRDLAQYNQQIADTQARLDAWNGIVGVYNSRSAELRRQQEEERRQRDAIAHDEAVARFEEEQRIKAEKQAEQERIGVHAVNPTIREKWDNAPKIEGHTDAITLPDGSTVRGRYVLTEAGAASASHDVNNAYMPTEGFPIDENGQSVNDRDYMRDKDAQRIVEQMAGAYDNRALQTPVIVSKDGVVLSGNNRTMSGDLAARQGTDKAYVDYLREFGHKYGFTPEQVQDMSNPRLVFVPDEDMPYDATTFSRFNAQEMKSQSKPEAAVKLGKIVPDNVFTNIANDISRYDRLSDYYADEKAVAHALGALMQTGVINDKQMPEMRTGTALSAAGKELIENTLIGKVFQTSPDAVRQIISMPTLRQSIVMGLNEIANNRTLARNGYDISEELATAVDLVSRAKTAMPDVYTDGMPVSPFGRMQGLFDDEFGDSRVTDATALLLADILNSGKPSDLRKVLTTYNNEAAQASGGQMDMFSGSIPTKEEILTNVNEHFRNATPKEQQALVDAAIAERKRRAEAEQRGRDQESEQTPNDVERRPEPQQPAAVAEEELTPEEQALAARIEVTDNDWTEGDGDTPTYKRDIIIDGTHKATQVDAPDEDGHYTGSYFEFDGKRFGDIAEIARYIDGGMKSEPTEAQKAAGNYKMEHRRVDGYNISIENAKGSVRRGTGADGKPWETTMQNDYGYIRGTEGVDGDHIDVFLSDTPEKGDVFVVDQVNEDGSFDEHKVMYGFPTEQAAREAYLSNYEPGWTGLGAITHVSKEEFKKWIHSSKRKTKPFAEYKSVRVYKEQNPQLAIEPDGFSDFGPVFTQFKGNAQGAIKVLSELQDGEAIGALHHKDIGDIDLVWGNAGTAKSDGFGLAKLVKYHPEVVEHLQEILDDMHIVKRSENRINLESDTHKAAVRLTWNKEKKKWLLTAFEKKETPKSIDKTTDTGDNPTDLRGGTALSQNSGVSDGKDNTLSADKQTDGAESSEPYTITPTSYTNKKGKTSDVHLVRFNRELTAEEKAALNTFAREPLTEGKKTSRGWYDLKQGGYMMRSEEAARQLAEMIGNEEAVADAQPMTAEELREAVGASRTRNSKPKKSPINRVSLEDVMTDLSTKSETKLSDHAEPINKEPEAQHEISDDEMQSLADELRDLLGIGEEEGDTDIRFRDPGELTPQERQRIQSVGIRLAMGLVERGTTSFPDYATKMVGLLGDKIRPWLKSFYEGARWTPGYEKYAFTPSEQVAVFDVQNFDKKQADPIAQATMIVEERKASTASAQAQKELTETRNKNRRENDKQREADTAAVAGEAEAVAGEAEVTAQSAGTGETGRKRILRDLKRVDDSLDEVNDQLALLGYYEADLDAPEHEVYGLRRSAEKKAVKDAVKLAQQLVNDLGLEVDKITGSTTEKRSKKATAVSANVVPVGGDIVINLPYPDGRNLHVNIGLIPTHERGIEPKRGGGAWEGDNYEVDTILFRFEGGDGRRSENHFLPTNVTYGKMLSEIERASKWGQPKKQDAIKSEQKFPDLNDKDAVSKWLEDNSAAIWKGVDAIMVDARYDENLLNTFRADNSEWVQESVVGEFVDKWICERLEEVMSEHIATVKAWFDYGQRGLMADVIAERMGKIVAEEKASAKAEETHNGYKVGDEVMWDRYGNGKWEKVKIEDFDTDGSPIFESVKGIISEKGDWSRVKPADGVFGEAQRVARAEQKKRRAATAGKKKNAIKPEQHVGDLFGGLFGADSSTAQASVEEERQKQTASSPGGQDLTTGSTSESDVDTGAKLVISNKRAVKNELKILNSKYIGQKRTHGFLSDLVKALGTGQLRRPAQTHYYIFESDTGEVFTLRISNHNVNATNHDGKTPEISIVIKSRRQPNRFVGSEDTDVTEYVYFKEDIANGDGHTLSWIVYDLSRMLDTGVYTDTSGLAVINRTFSNFKENEKETDLQPRPGTAERERGHEPQPNGPLGESQRNEAKGTDGRGMGGRDSVNPLSDRERGSGVSRQPKSQPVAERAPETERKNVRNNHAERGVDYAPKGEDARIKANIEAIELAKRLLDAGETATPEQMAVLRKFSGWGGLGKAFNEQGYTPNPTAKRLRELLGEQGYQDAVDSRRSAYYTPAEVIDTMWDVAKAMGFKGGKVLEGSAGIGNILGLMPSELSDRSSIHAVEIDSTTGGILSLLYPDAKVEIQGFEKTRVQNGTIDLAITNVPFITGAKVFDETGDKDLSKKFHDIHDFCIAKNIRKLREGGIGIFITSSGTMDNSKELRRWIISEGNADVVGAFRMHNKTFGGTGATSDIIVVRKRVNGKPSPNAIDVTDVTGVRVADYDTGDTRKVKGQEIPIIKPYSMIYNKYFAEHPENMAGEMMFNFERGETRYPTSRALFPVKGKEQSEMLSAWASRFADMEEEAAAPKIEDEVTRINEQLGEGVKEGSMVLNSQGELCMARMGEAVPLGLNKNKVKGHTKAECFNAYTAIKKALSDVLEYQSTHEDNEGLAPLLKELNRTFDTFTRTYGNFHKNTAISFLRNDVDFSSILALETYSEKGDKKGNKVVKVGKTDIFSRRVIETEKEPQPTTIKDGILASLYKNGGVDVEYISQALGKSTEDVKREIVESGLGFENPSTGAMEVSYQYLSGNVREKLHIAQENNEGGKYDANIKALESVMPMTIPAHLIEFALGSSWIEPKLYEDFVFEKTGIRVTLTNVGGTWFMKTPWSTFNEKNRSMAVVSKMCDKTIMGHELIESAITNKQITVSKTVKHYDGTTETITDKTATAECGTKVDEIRAEFKDWAREHMQADPEMSARIEQTYNDQFNNYVPMSIPDDFVPQHFGGQVSELHGQPFALRPHQGRAVVRGTTEPILLAHEVGTGKTYTLITTAMEMRRLGTARKPMIVVQNATVGQFVESAKEIYPNAKVLTIEEVDRTAEGRRNFYAKIKYNDWDMIVVPQSVFERIPDSPEREMAYVKEIIEEKMKVLEAMHEADSDGRSMIVRQAKKELAEQEERLAELTEAMQGKKKKRDEKKEATTRQNAEVRALEMLDREVDDVENFDDMGIDAILVDEAHEYKHLGFSTAMQRGVKGVDPSYSKKAQGVFLKAQAVMERNNGRNVVFATGTPISNTAAEIWTFMRYLMPADTMKAYGIYYFDDFVRNFGNIAQMVEFVNGKFKENNRFAGYVNLPELIRIWSSVADTVLTRDAGEVSGKIPEMESGKPQDIYLPQTRALRSVMKYIRAELERYDNLTGREKKENSHIPMNMYTIGVSAAVDTRLVVDDAPDEPNSKTNAVVKETLRSLKDSASYKGTIAIFADHYQNVRSGFNLYEDIRKKLIAEGVPAGQIVVIKSGMSIKKKLDIFEKVNAGEIRVIMGSTSTLGTGVNIQERLHTLVHMDAPNRPMDYIQRNGRILRQGNLHKDMGVPVRVLRFGVEDSADVTAYQRLKTKGAISDAVMDGSKLLNNSMDNRVIEEDEDQYGDMLAQLSGSEYAILKNQAEREVRSLTAKQKGHDIDQIYVHNQLPKVEGFIKGAERRIALETKNLEIIGKHFPDGSIKKITIGKLTFDSVGTMEDFFKEQNAKMNKAAEAIREGADNYTSKLTVDVDGLQFEVTTTVKREVGNKGQGSLSFEPERNVTYSCEALGIKDEPVKGNRLKNVMQKIAEDIATGNASRELLNRGQQQLAHYSDEYRLLQERNGREFPYKAQLAEARERLAKYEELMKKEMEEKEAKYAEMDKSVEAASDVTLTEEDSEDTQEQGRFRDGEYMTPGERLRAIMALVPVEVERNTLSRSELFAEYRTLPDVTKDGINIQFLRTAFGKNYKEGGLFAQVVPHLDNLLLSSVLAYSEEDSLGGTRRPDGTEHKTHPNVTSFDNYVNKVKIGGSEYYVRMTVQKTVDNTTGLHSCFVSNVDVYKKAVTEETGSAISRSPNQPYDGIVDAKLQQFFERASAEALELDKADRVRELSEKLNTPVRIVTEQSEIDNLPSARHRRAKGYFDPTTGEIVIVVPNNRNVADVDNTVVHEVVGHKGLRALIGARFDEFLGEVYDHASNLIRKVIDKKTDDMVNAEADRLRVRKVQARERAGEDVNANYYADMAQARVSASLF